MGGIADWPLLGTLPFADLRDAPGSGNGWADLQHFLIRFQCGSCATGGVLGNPLPGSTMLAVVRGWLRGIPFSLRPQL